MGVTTVTVNKIAKEPTYRVVRTFVFTYQLRPGISTNACNGVCWDGAYLVFVTNGEAFLEKSNFIWVDPDSGILINNIEPPATVGGFDADHIDVCFDGHSFYVIRQDDIQGNGIDQYSRQGTFIRTVVSGLANVETAIDFDGRSLVTNNGLNGLIRFYDPVSGSLLRTITSTVTSGAVEGIAIDRNYGSVWGDSPGGGEGPSSSGNYGSLIRKIIEEFGNIQFFVDDPSSGLNMRIRNLTVTGTNHRENFTWDGTYFWTFQESTL